MTGIAPWIVVEDVDRAADFYTRAFDAEVVERLGDEQLTMVARLQIGSAEVWLQVGEAPGPAVDGLADPPVRMILTVSDPDATFARALAAGAVQIASVHEEHGWRTGRLRDPFGHQWETARRTG